MSYYVYQYLMHIHSENDCRNYLRINLHESVVVGLGLRLTTPGSAVRRAVDCACEPAQNGSDGSAELEFHVFNYKGSFHSCFLNIVALCVFK